MVLPPVAGMPILHFKGKSVIQNHHHTVKFHELEAVKSKSTSKAPSLDDNLIIHGDNLIALKALLPTYAGKVKCIYIDPPYNTGNEHWIYNDNVNSPMIKEWLGEEVALDDLTRHDKWCCMMYPRLCLLRELLRDDGVIFISVDDNEVYHLRMMMDEIFGEENFIGLFVVNSSPSAIDYGHIATMNDYALFYENADIILDSFAGSGTTAHAVLELNAEDGGNRKFILVECEDYADKLTAERVRRVSKGVKGAKDERLKKGLGGTFSYYELGEPIDIDKMLEGDGLPSYANLAHYAFFTATGETFDPKKMKEKEYYIGSSNTYEIFMLYAPDAAKLRKLALNLEFAQQIEKKFPGKAKLVFAPACFLEEFDLRDRNIRFAQLPFEIYRLAE